MTVATEFDQLVSHLRPAWHARETANMLSKALEAQRQGVLTGRDVALIEAAANRRLAMPAELVDVLARIHGEA